MTASDRVAPTEPLQVTTAWLDIARHPYEHLVRRWNWKSAVTSTIIRGAIFFTVNLSAGSDAAVSALLTEFGYRALLSGVIGSVTQTLRKCQPAWAATLSASIVLPAFTHLVEFTVHSIRGTPRLAAGVAASIAFTVLAVLFNLYAMRHGVFLVDQDQKSLLQDFAAMPKIIAGFVAAGPIALWRPVRRKG